MTDFFLKTENSIFLDDIYTHIIISALQFISCKLRNMLFQKYFITVEMSLENINI